MKHTSTDELLKPAEAARLIGITRGGVFYAIENGLIASEKHGPYRLISKSEALRYKHHRLPAGRRKKKAI